MLSCALQIPISDVTNVEVQRGNGSGFEQPLSNGDVVDPTLYQDPQDRNALPVVASNGSSGPNYYARPFRGGSDGNGRDGVTADGPITILVWVKSQPLVVAIKPHPVPGSKALKFSASVKTAEGTAVSPSSLKWQWTFQDTGETSTEPTPVHGSTWTSYFVSVQVTDSASGDAGTDTRSVTTPNKPAPGKQNQSGGHKDTNSKSPTGKDNGGSNDKPGGGYCVGAAGPDDPHAPAPDDAAVEPRHEPDVHDALNADALDASHDPRHDPNDDTRVDADAVGASAEAHQASEHAAAGHRHAGDRPSGRRRHAAAAEVGPARPRHRLRRPRCRRSARPRP